LKKENTAESFLIFFWSKLQFTYSLASIKDDWTTNLQDKSSALKREHPVLKIMKFINLFSIFMGHFCPPGPWSGSNPDTDPDPQHCFAHVALSHAVPVTRFRSTYVSPGRYGTNIFSHYAPFTWFMGKVATA
jgi:hypothetical protein